MIEYKEIASVKQLLEEVETLPNLVKARREDHKGLVISPPIYRGQANADWKLQTTLERHRSGDPTGIMQYNRYVARVKPAIESLTGQSWEFDHSPKLPSSFIWHSPPNYEYLVYLRHHGFPSPLLDWSASPYVALYFASAENYQADDMALFVLATKIDGLGVSGTGGLPYISRLGKYVTTHKRHFIQQAEYTICTAEDRSTWVYESHHDIFDLRAKEEYYLIKYTIPGALRDELLTLLDSMNINEFTLFGTEDALLRSLVTREPFELFP